MIAAVGVFSAVAFSAWTDRGGATVVRAIHRADQGESVSNAASAALGPIEPRVSLMEIPRPVRSAAATTDVVQGFHATLRVVDAQTGLTIPTAWFQRSEFGALDGRDKRHQAQRSGARVKLWVEGARATILVSAPQYTTRDVAIDRAGAHEVRLERATSLIGTVRDGQSALVPDARVTLEFLGADFDGLTEEAEPLAFKGATLCRTNADGQYAFTNLAPGVYRTVAVIDGAEHTSRPTQVHAGAWVMTDHWLDEATRLLVQVDQPDGLPAARSRLLLSEDGASTHVLTRYTDDDGRATLGPLDPGKYNVSVQSTDGVTDPQSFTIEDDGQAAFDLHIQLARPDASPDGRSQEALATGTHQ